MTRASRERCVNAALWLIGSTLAVQLAHWGKHLYSSASARPAANRETAADQSDAFLHSGKPHTLAWANPNLNCPWSKSTSPVAYLQINPLIAPFDGHRHAFRLP